MKRCRHASVYPLARISQAIREVCAECFVILVDGKSTGVVAKGAKTYKRWRDRWLQAVEPNA